jgi:hypothetical protein
LDWIRTVVELYVRRFRGTSVYGAAARAQLLGERRGGLDWVLSRKARQRQGSHGMTRLLGLGPFHGRRVVWDLDGTPTPLLYCIGEDEG